MRKAQGLSVTTIIIAALALIVLVVLIAIFTGRIGNFSTGVSKTVSCENSCNAFGKQWRSESSDACTTPTYTNPNIVPGKYDDAPLGCCCFT